MSCVSLEELIGLALESEVTEGRLSLGERAYFRGAKGDNGHASAHLAACPTCRTALEDWRRLMTRVSAAHEVFDVGHADGRERLMAALAAESVSRSRSPIQKGRLSMKQRFAYSSIAAAAALLLAVWLVVVGRPLSAMEQVAAKIREAKSFSIEMSSEIQGKSHPGGKFYWKAPGSVRLEEIMLPEGNPVASIFPHHQPGIEIDEQHKTFKQLPAREGFVSPLMAVWKLGSFSGEADKELPPRKIGDRPARGFQIAAEKIDSSLKGTIDIWVDTETDLPVLVEYEMAPREAKMIMHHFQWNTPLDAKLFDTAPPEGYADKTPKPPSVEEIVEPIRDGLKFYSEVMGGHYPRVKMVYGDVTMNELNDKLGLKQPLSGEQIKSDAYVKSLRAILGFGSINGILRDNADAAYYGKTVGPDDKDMILLRWKLDDGQYHVIYGDLHSETVDAGRLKALESQ